MKSTMMEVESPLCTGSHLPKYIYFCKNCAASKLPIDKVFFCSECRKDALKTHGNHHGDRNPIDTEFFQLPYRGFKESVQTTNRMHFITQIRKTDQEKPVKECTAIMNNYLKDFPPVYKSALNLTTTNLATELAPYAYRKWIVEHLFWTKPPYSPTLNRAIESYVLKVAAGSQPVNNEWNNFEINLGPRSAAAEKLLEKSKESLRNTRNYEKQEKVSRIFLKILGCITDKEIDECLNEINELLKDKDLPAFVLQVGQLKLLELHREGAHKMKDIISNLNIKDKSSREKELFYYLSSVAEWKVVPNSQSSNAKVFYDNRNKLRYVIDRPQEYIRFLTSAISESKKPLYFACRALGYMSQGNYAKAEEDFLEADKQDMKSDALDNNHNFNKILKNDAFDSEQAQDNLHKREIEYVVNLAKYFKRSQLYNDLQRCCLELVNREPHNSTFHCKLLECYIKLNYHDKAEAELQQIEKLKANVPLEEYEKKIQFIKAREDETREQIDSAKDKYENVTRLGKRSATAFYNYAAFLFKNRHDLDLNNKALEAIETAIEIKPKDKFYELKYLILFVMGNMEQARAIEKQFKDKEGKYAAMKDYIHQNT